MARNRSSSSPNGQESESNPGVTGVPITLEPPHNTEAEQKVIGAMIITPAHIPLVVARIGGPANGSKFFYHTNHSILYSTMSKLHADGKPVDTTTLLDALGDSLDKYGGVSYMGQLMEIAPYTESDVMAYLDIVIRKRRERVRLRTAQKIISSCGKLNDTGSIDYDFLTETDEFIRSDIFGNEETTTRTIAEICTDVINEWQARITHGGIMGRTSHLPRLDALTGGWVNGRLYVIGARPAVGKTSIALQFADHVVKNLNAPACVVSLEMKDSDLIGRVVCQRARISYGTIQTDPTRFSAEADWEKIYDVFSEIHNSKWVVNDKSGIDVYQICTIIENAHNKHPLGLAVVDYLQLFAGLKEEFMVIAIAQAVAVLRECAKRLNIPIILISQLSRALESRKGDKRPVPSDLRDSGGIEQVADAIIFLYRDVLYNRNLNTTRAKSAAEVIVAKNRHGPCGTVHCFFDARTTRFFADDYVFAEMVLAREYDSVDEAYLINHRFVDKETGKIIVPKSGAAKALERDTPLDDELPPKEAAPYTPEDVKALKDEDAPFA